MRKLFRKSFKYPFFIIIDDCGFPYVNLDDSNERIPFSVYENILNIAKEFDIRIPLCFTVQFLDINNVSGYGQPLDYAEKLIKFLKENQEYIEIGYHGLTHSLRGHRGEFYLLDIDEYVPEKVQREHIEKSDLIFQDLGFDFPKLFVPPFHAWELGVTDRILCEFGAKYIVSLENLNDKYKLQSSRYLMFLPRIFIGIHSNDTIIDEVMLEKAKRLIIPTNLIFNIIYHGKVFNSPVHSYATHIGNFMNGNFKVWRELFNYVAKRSELRICRNNIDAIKNYLSIK
jgi:hypothetical protein